MKINKVIITIFVLLVMLGLGSAEASAKTYLFRTAAIDGPSYANHGLYVYINPCTINVGGVTKTGTPAANFYVNANTVYDVTYSASGYQTDTDDFFFDSGLPTCSGTTCHLITSHFDTHCTYSSTYKDWTCVVTDTTTSQWISFIYNKNDSTWGEVIRILNFMYPGECMPGETETRQCGQTDVGECSYGTQARTCQSNYYWGSWGPCTGAVYPTEEICDGRDNNCDGIIDNGGDMLCDDGIYCNGQETCEGALGCQPGTPVDCSYKDISGIDTCCNNPDNNPLTWDYRAAFTSECIDTGYNTGYCTEGDDTITHECSVDNCDAECDAENPCPETECNHLDGCVGNDYYDYHNIFNACLGDCTCEENACTDYDISYNDPKCTECTTDDDCSYLDEDFCFGDSIMHKEGICVNYECTTQTTTVQDCSELNNTFCEGTWIKGEEYTCEAAQCVVESADYIMDCDDGLWCNGQETCSNAQCFAGTAVDCSHNDITEIATCNFCDSNPYTWDYRDEFISTCDEETNSCTLGDETVTHECSVDNCEAECDATHTCPDTECSHLNGCVGSNYYSYQNILNVCLGDCTCEQNECGEPEISYNDSKCFDCIPGEEETISCYEGPEGTEGVGICTSGTKTRTCDSEGQWGSWGSCEGAVYPAEEICDELDNDCDGLVDEGGVCDTPLPDMNSVLGITRFSIINEDYLRPGDSIIILTTLENNGNVNLDNIRLTFVIPELDIRMRVGPFDIKRNKEITKLIILDIPYWAEPGYYDIRATASNGDVRRVKHREILIHN